MNVLLLVFIFRISSSVKGSQNVDNKLYLLLNKEISFRKRFAMNHIDWEMKGSTKNLVYDTVFVIYNQAVYNHL